VSENTILGAAAVLWRLLRDDGCMQGLRLSVETMSYRFGTLALLCPAWLESFVGSLMWRDQLRFAAGMGSASAHV